MPAESIVATASSDGQRLLKRGVLPSFPLAFVVAPFAGALTAGTVATILAAPLQLGLGPWRSQVGTESLWDRLWATLGTGMLTAYLSFFIAAAYTAIIGGLVVVRHRKTGKTLSRATTLVCGLITGVLPFAAFPLLLGGVPSEFTTNGGPGAEWTVTFFLSVAATASLATAWTFWRCGLEGRSSR